MTSCRLYRLCITCVPLSHWNKTIILLHQFMPNDTFMTVYDHTNVNKYSSEYNYYHLKHQSTMILGLAR